MEDFEFDQDQSILSQTDTLTQSALNLILTGHATKYLHNGIQNPNNFGANKVIYFIVP